MTTPHVTSVMIDCHDPHALAAFWGALLGVGVRSEYEQWVWLEPQREHGWTLAFQRVPDPTPGKNKIHLDGHHPDLDDLQERILRLGGSFVRQEDIDGFTWRVFADPEGNVFCFGHDT